MKFLFPALALVTLSLSASANWFGAAGNFSAPHPIPFLNYENEAACTADHGKWEEELCWFDAADDISVKPNGTANEYDVTVDTITTNGHSCGFDGEGQWTGSGILATAPSEEWDGDNLVPATCEVTLHYVDDNTIDVTNNGKCTSFCGARATLETEGAKRTGE